MYLPDDGLLEAETCCRYVNIDNKMYTTTGNVGVTQQLGTFAQKTVAVENQ
jgi:hypothetical protein